MSTPAADRSGAFRVALDNDYPVVVLGLHAMLTRHSERIEVVPLDEELMETGGIDLVLKDAFAMSEDLTSYVAAAPAPVVVFAATQDDEAIRAALAQGASGFIHKGTDVEGLIGALERVRAGQRVVHLSESPKEDAVGTRDWPGRGHGLTERESEVLSLICQGRSNQQVAQTLYLSINSVKTYIRSLYRKIDAGSRSQAVIWGLQHGFSPRAGRGSLA